MTPERRQLLLRSWATLDTRGSDLADIFYRHLFALDPSTEQMFARTAMAEQREKFMGMMRAIVGLEDDSGLVSSTAALARRHVGYGVRDKDYDTVGEAVMRTLEDGLGTTLTPELRGIWNEWLVVLTTLMRRAAERPRSPAP